MSDWNRQVIQEFRANQGKVGGPFEGAPVLILHTRGKKSGEEQVAPLMYLDFDGGRYIFASKAGADTNPAWYHNLSGDSAVSVEVGSETYTALASPVSDAERDRIYAEQARRYPRFGEYQANTDRLIPVVRLTRQG